MLPVFAWICCFPLISVFNDYKSPIQDLFWLQKDHNFVYSESLLVWKLLYSIVYLASVDGHTLSDQLWRYFYTSKKVNIFKFPPPLTSEVIFSKLKALPENYSSQSSAFCIKEMRQGSRYTAMYIIRNLYFYLYFSKFLKRAFYNSPFIKKDNKNYICNYIYFQTICFWTMFIELFC